MGKLVVPLLGLGLVGVLAWFLMREPVGGEVKPAAPVSTAGAAAGASATEPEAPVTAARVPRPVNALPERPPLPALGQTPSAALAAEAPAAEEAPAEIQMPTATLDEVKDSVRSYYGNLPRTGKMPPKVTLDEVLPEHVIRQLGAPADAPLVMLGHRSPSEREAYTEVLEMSADYQQMLGVSWTDPDGTQRRHYVRMTVPEKAQP